MTRTSAIRAIIDDYLAWSRSTMPRLAIQVRLVPKLRGLWPPRAWFGSPSIVGQARWPATILIKESAFTIPIDTREAQIVAHETEHLLQMRRFSSRLAWWYAYAREYIQWGYRNSYFESEARAQATEWSSARWSALQKRL